MHEKENEFRLHASCSAEVMSKEEFHAVLEELDNFVSNLLSYPNERSLPSSFVAQHENESRDSSTLTECDDRGQDWTKEQHALAIIIADFSKVDLKQIAHSTTLAALGVDSISSIQIAALARKENLPIRAADIAKCDTVGEVLALATSSSEPSKTAPYSLDAALPSELSERVIGHIPSHLRQHVERVLPVAAGMEWNIGGWHASGGQSFKHAFVYSLPANEELANLKHAWLLLSERHEILRSNFLILKPPSSFRIGLYVMRDAGRNWNEVFATAREDNEMEAVRKMARTFVHDITPVGDVQTRVGIVHGSDQNYFVLALHHSQYGACSH